MRHLTVLLLLSLVSVGCATQPYDTIGQLEVEDARFNDVVAPGTPIEIIASGFSWIEGPVWVESENALVFSNIPPNKAWKWTEAKGAEHYLSNAGDYDGPNPRPTFDAKVINCPFDQPGSNGLTLSPDNRLVLMQHGSRSVAIMDAPLDKPEPKYITLTNRNHEGKKYNSPNDGCFDKAGNFYFTDPPYGLPLWHLDPTRETDYCGVYRVAIDGKVTLIDDDLERPNGIALSPDEKTLYVANSHGPRAIVMAYQLNDDGSVKSKKVFHDFTPLVGKRKGMPDGLKVNDEGVLFITAPGGVWVFTPKGEHLGTIHCVEFASNVALDDDQQTLYITADMLVLRVRLKP
jgi:gluconolactonase